MHVGGGRGGRDDDELFRFKCLFSDLLFPFYTGRWILDQQRYEQLVSERRHQAELRGEDISVTSDFFPAYRAAFRSGSGTVDQPPSDPSSGLPTLPERAMSG